MPRIIVVLEENHSYHQIIGSPELPRLNQMAAQGMVLTKYFAIRHPSLPNYIAIVSGDTHGIKSDCGRCNINFPNLADQLTRAGISWKVYAEDLPAPCSKDITSNGNYAKKHLPFLYFASVRNDAGKCGHIVPYSQLTTDASTGQLPTFVFIVPNLDHDMHGVGEGKNDHQVKALGDAFASDLLNKLERSSAWHDDTRVVITFDEGAGAPRGEQTTCCNGLAVGGHIPTIIFGPKIGAGHDNQTYTHYALLKSIETRYQLPLLGHAADPTTQVIPALVAP